MDLALRVRCLPKYQYTLIYEGGERKQIQGMNENQKVYYAENAYKKDNTQPQTLLLDHFDLTFNFETKMVINKRGIESRYELNVNQDGILVNFVEDTLICQYSSEILGTEQSADGFVDDDKVLWRIWWK